MSLMRHRCDRHGCYYKHHVVKFDRFQDCFGGAINFSDIDSIVEVRGHFLTADWKHPAKREPDQGQHILFQQLSRLKNWTCLIVSGDCSTMTIESVCKYDDGVKGPWVSCDMDTFKRRLRVWYKKALNGKTQ